MIGVGDFGIFSGFPDGMSSSNIRSSPFLISVVDGGRFGRFVYQLAGKSCWFSSITGGFLFLRGASLSGESGLLVIEVPDPLLSSVVIATDHLDWCVR